MEKQHRGFRAMDPATQKRIASKGGKTAQANGTAHQWTPEQAKAAGRKGGLARGVAARAAKTAPEAV